MIFENDTSGVLFDCNGYSWVIEILFELSMISFLLTKIDEITLNVVFC